jgi:hypothetical protein
MYESETGEIAVRSRLSDHCSDFGCGWTSSLFFVALPIPSARSVPRYMILQNKEGCLLYLGAAARKRSVFSRIQTVTKSWERT